MPRTNPKDENRKSKIENSSPSAFGYSMPPEWHPHAATWLAWPHNVSDWPGKYGPIPWIFAEIVRLIAQGEHVNLFIPSTPKIRPAREISALLTQAGVNLKNVTLIPQATDRIWTRDSGPIFLTRKKSSLQSPAPLALVDFNFNAWAKYPDYKNDAQLPAVIAQRLKISRFNATYPAPSKLETGNWKPETRFVLEGGSIDLNGGHAGGCLLTTEECLLSTTQQRNPNLTRDHIEATLRAYLGVAKVLWLSRGIAGDDTHGHVDDTARFLNPTTIVTSVETNKNDVNFLPMRENLRRLRRFRDTRNRPFTIVELPLPKPVIFQGQRLPASYANFYFCNAGLLVPVFNDPHDTLALITLASLVKDRPIIPVYARDLVWGLGTLHCLTQQQPAI